MWDYSIDVVGLVSWHDSLSALGIQTDSSFRSLNQGSDLFLAPASNCQNPFRTGKNVSALPHQRRVCLPLAVAQAPGNSWFTRLTRHSAPLAGTTEDLAAPIHPHLNPRPNLRQAISTSHDAVFVWLSSQIQSRIRPCISGREPTNCSRFGDPKTPANASEMIWVVDVGIRN